MKRDDLLGYLSHDNVAAFLRVIREGESSNDDSAYTILNGGEHFEAPPWEHPNRVGKGGASTAAGAYQIVIKTWTGLVSQYGFEDFSPQSQDQAAVALILGHRGAMDHILAGRVREAIRVLNEKWIEWECFENPLFLAKVKDIFVAYGGRLEGDTSAPILPVTPDQEEKEEVKPMAPFLGALISAALSAAPDLIRLIGNGERSQKNAAVVDKVAAVAMQVTGAVNEQQAAEKLQEAATAERFRAAVRDEYDQWLAMTVKFREMDDASIIKAREYNSAAGRHPVLFNLTFIEELSLIFVAVSSFGAWMVLQGNFPAEIKGAVITLVLIGGFTGVKEFWFGSSRGSMVKETK